MLAAAGLLIGIGVLTIVAVGAKVIQRKEDVAAQAAQQRTAIQETFDTRQREVGRNTPRDLEIALATAAAGIATGTAVGAALGAGLGPAGAVVGAFVGVFVGLIKAAIDTEAYGTVVRESLKTYLRALGQPTSAAHVDALLWRDGLLGASWVWFNAKTGELAVEVLALAHGRREHFHDLPYPPRTSLDSDTRRGQRVPGRASDSVRELVAGANAERLDGPDQRSDRRAWWSAMDVGDLYVIQYSTGHAAWNPAGSYTSGPGFRSLWPSLRTAKTARTDAWVKIAPDPTNVDMLAQPFDRAARIAWEAST